MTTFCFLNVNRNLRCNIFCRSHKILGMHEYGVWSIVLKYIWSNYLILDLRFCIAWKILKFSDIGAFNLMIHITEGLCSGSHMVNGPLKSPV